MVYDEYEVESKSNKALISIAEEDKNELCPIDQDIQCFNTNISKISNDNYDLILEGDDNNNLHEQTVLYIMASMLNNIYLRLINNCNNTLDIAKKHKVKVFNPQDIENNIKQFEISRENINIELNNLLVEQEPGVQYKKIFTLLDEQPELLFAQIINLQNSLKEFELLFSDSQDISGTIKRLQKCINIANTLLLSNTEQVSLKDTNAKKAKKPFDRLMNITSVANMLCDSLAWQDIAGANPQYFRALSIKVNKIKTMFQTKYFVVYDALFDFHDYNKYIQVVNYIFRDNTLCLDTLDKIQTNIRNYTTRDTLDLNQKAAANAEIKFLFAGMKFIVERIYAMIEPYFKPQDVVYNSKTTKQQDVTNKNYSANNVYMRNINTQKFPSLDTNTLKDQNPTNMRSTKTEKASLHTKTKRSTDSIPDAAPLSNENNLTNIGVDVINNDINDTSTSIENKNSARNIIPDAPNDLINKVNTADNTNINVNEKSTQHSNKLPSLNTNTLEDQNPTNMLSAKTEKASLHTKTKRSTDSIPDAAPLSNENNLTNIGVDIINNDSNDTSTSIENKNLTSDITQDTPNDLINKVNVAANTNIQTTYTESIIEQKGHKEHAQHRTNINVNEKSTQHSNKLPSLNTNTLNTLKGQNPTNMLSAKTEKASLHTKAKRSTDSITDTAPLSNENNLTNIGVDIINNDSNDTSTSIENKNLTSDITQDTPNDLINKVNVAANTNIQTTYTESIIEQKGHKEHAQHRTNINVKAASTSEQPQKIMVTSKITSTTKEPSANVDSAPKKYTKLHPYSASLNDTVGRPDIVTTVTFISINHKYSTHGTINNARSVQLNDKDATYHNDNINNNNRTHHIPITYQLVVNTIPVVSIYNDASITNTTTTNTTTTNTTTMFGEYNTKTLNNNDVNYIIGYRNLISNNLAKMQLDNFMSYNGTVTEIGTLQHQQLYYNMQLSSHIICYSKLLSLRNFVSSYKSPQYKGERFEKHACDKILIDRTGYNINKDHDSFLEALNYGHKLFDLILRCTNTYQELHKQYPNKSMKELLLTSSLINNLDAHERQNLTNIYMSITTNILGLSENTQYAQRMSFGTKLQPLILKRGIETPKRHIAHGIDGLAIDMHDSKLRIDDIEQDVILRTASIPIYIDPQLGIKSISLAFTDSFGHMPLESEVLYMAIHYDNTGNIVAFHYPPTTQFIGQQPVITTLKGNYFGPCTRDTIQQLERHISANESCNKVLSASMTAI